MKQLAVNLDTKNLIMQAAIRAAEAQASRDSTTPAEAAMKVVCASLIAHCQLNVATGDANPVPAEISREALEAAGFKAPSAEVEQAMRQLGIAPLLLTARLRAIVGNQKTA